MASRVDLCSGVKGVFEGSSELGADGGADGEGLREKREGWRKE